MLNDSLENIVRGAVRERIELILQIQGKEQPEKKRERVTGMNRKIDDIWLSLPENQRRCLDEKLKELMEEKEQAYHAIYKAGVIDGIRLMKKIQDL